MNGLHNWKVRLVVSIGSDTQMRPSGICVTFHFSSLLVPASSSFQTGLASSAMRWPPPSPGHIHWQALGRILPVPIIMKIPRLKTPHTHWSEGWRTFSRQILVMGPAGCGVSCTRICPESGGGWFLKGNEEKYSSFQKRSMDHGQMKITAIGSKLSSVKLISICCLKLF